MTNTNAVKPEVFITEKFFDVVKVGSVSLSGQLAKVPRISLKKGEDAIEWTTDFYLAGMGWKICKAQKSGPPMLGGKKPKKPILNCNEELKGDKSEGYRGCQDETRSGRKCQDWSSQSPHKHTESPTNPKYSEFKLIKNYCRNPDGQPSIWCYTMDPKKRWELCNPVGLVKKKNGRYWMLSTVNSA